MSEHFFVNTQVMSEAK